jgi:hypothetical protein
VSRPRFSIVIPTRNRADLLPGAVRSALHQTWRDLEVVVSDNDSDDSTSRVVAAFDDPRLRYVRTSSSLLMHESWRFALRAARGEYVGFLCDDDALHPRAIELAERAIQSTGADVVAWRSCSYCLPDWPIDRQRGRVRFGPPYTDRAWKIDGPRLLDLTYDLRVTFSELVPKMLNCVVSRDLIARLRRYGAELFYPSSPDYSAMVVLAAYAAEIILIDAPMLIAGASARSIGASTLTSYAATRRYGARVLACEAQLRAPPVLGPRITWLAQTYMQCAHCVPTLRGRVVNPVHLYGLAGRELEDARDAGIEAADFMAQYKMALRTELFVHIARVRRFLRQRPEIESEAFLERLCAREPNLGLGPFIMNEMSVDDEQASGSDGIAVCLDHWLRSRSTRLDDFWNELCKRAGSRWIVFYGMGRNGKALLRGSSGMASRVTCCDDYAAAADHASARCICSRDLEPAAHYVCVTADEGERMRVRLSRSGFVEQEDWSTMREICTLLGTRAPNGRMAAPRHRVRDSAADSMARSKTAHTREM